MMVLRGFLGAVTALAVMQPAMGQWERIVDRYLDQLGGRDSRIVIGFGDDDRFDHDDHGDRHPSHRSRPQRGQGGMIVYQPAPRPVVVQPVRPEIPDDIRFGDLRHVDQLAWELEQLINEFCLDLHYNYSHNPGFDITYAEAYELLEIARFMHTAEHHHDREAMRSRLAGADALFHHVQDDIRGWSRIHRRQIGMLGIMTKTEMIEETLHHLMRDVGVHPAPLQESAPPPLSIPESAPPPAPRS